MTLTIDFQESMTKIHSFIGIFPLVMFHHNQYKESIAQDYSHYAQNASPDDRVTFRSETNSLREIDHFTDLLDVLRNKCEQWNEPIRLERVF